ncbi:MAG TPA: ATP-binding protein [Ignavibacteriales bacterium]|nr:ATP-binding protein [Ignavibacteriales bacterium]
MNKLFASSLRRKILLGFIIVILIMLGITFWGIYNFYRINQSFKLTITQNYSTIIAADNMTKSVDEQLNALILSFNGDILYGRALFEKAQIDFLYWYQKARESAFTMQEKVILDSLQIDNRRFIQNVYQRIDFETIDRSNANFDNLYFKLSIESLNRIKTKCYGIFEINHNIMSATIVKVDNIARTATIFMIFIVTAGIAASFLFITRFSNRLAEPLQDLIKTVKHIGEGNFSDRINIIRSDDEVGNLADEFNKMIEKLERYEKMNLNKILYEMKKAEVIVENINEPVVVIDENMKMIIANKVFQSVFRFRISSSSRLSDAISDKTVLENIQALFNGENKNIDDIISVESLSGEKQYFNVVHSLIKIPDGPSGIALVFNDITKFQELDRMKSEFIGKVSHELKTPLTSIGMAVGLLQDGVAGKLNDKQSSLISTMRDDYNRLSKLVKEILELTKIESGSLELRYETINPVLMVRAIMKDFAMQSSNKNIALEFAESRDGVPFINGDYDYLLRALENIVSNSLKFTPEGGKIKFEIAGEEKFINIRISDTGIGIPPENIDRIFDKFVQVKNNVSGSVGLGLTIAKEIIEMHGGSIHVESELNKGSIFEIRLQTV